MQKKTKKRIILVALLAIVIAGSLYFPAKKIITFSIDCKSRHDSLRLQNQDVIEELNKVEILSGQTPTEASVTTYGGCDPINPLGITIKKSYTGPFSGGDVVDSIRNQLKSSGYSFTREDFGSEGCKAIYRSEATKNKNKIYVAAAQTENRIIGCTDGYPTGISEQVYRKQTIDTVLLTPKS